MFRSMLGDFNEDPIFGIDNQMSRMERMMDSMMPSFDDMFAPPFGMPGFPALMGLPGSRMDRRNPRARSNALLPFGFSNAGPLFPNMVPDRFASDPNCHSFSSSSVMTYSMGGDGQPNVYQASSSTRMAPGGVKEITKTTLNSATGEQKMTIGRHLGEKAHIMEKSKNQYTGDEDESEEFLNLDDAEVNSFNQEWKQKAPHTSSRSANQISSHHPYQRPTLAITDGSGRQEDRQLQKHGKKNVRKGKR